MYIPQIVDLHVAFFGPVPALIVIVFALVFFFFRRSAQSTRLSALIVHERLVLVAID